MSAIARAARGARYCAVALKAMVTQPILWMEMWRFELELPAHMADQPLPDLMAQLGNHLADVSLEPSTVRDYADSVAAFDVRSPLGICLRRSLVRYHFLRRAGLPVVIHFGARFKETREIGGHAWVTLNGAPYAEASENYQGFAVMYSYPVVGT